MSSLSPVSPSNGNQMSPDAPLADVTSRLGLDASYRVLLMAMYLYVVEKSKRVTVAQVFDTPKLKPDFGAAKLREWCENNIFPLIKALRPPQSHDLVYGQNAHKAYMPLAYDNFLRAWRDELSQSCPERYSKNATRIMSYGFLIFCTTLLESEVRSRLMRSLFSYCQAKGMPKEFLITAMSAVKRALITAAEDEHTPKDIANMMKQRHGDATNDATRIITVFNKYWQGQRPNRKSGGCHSVVV